MHEWQKGYKKYIRHRNAVFAWLRKNSDDSLDVLNRDFVDFFEEETKSKVETTFYGANKCRALGAVLSKMYMEGLLTRWACGLPGMVSGFPRWVWSYRPISRGIRTMRFPDEA